MDLKLVQRLLPYAAIAIITTLPLWSHRSRRCRATSGRSNDSDDEEAEVSSPPRVREDGFQYDVFLSFRGSDTRKTFADLLYQALKDKGITTFIDSKKLEKGKKLDVLLEYIQRSQIFVPIFSPGYADSEWCLKEIAQMVECKRVILPVFVDVEPTDVRRQTGPFESAFSEHSNNKEIDQVEASKWRNALKEAGSASGYTLAATNGYHGKLIQQIVKRILSEVHKTSKLRVAEHPVGLDSRIQDVMKVLETEALDDVRMVGICGMGGIGKTTLSKAVYNAISSCFDACSFISNVREAAEPPSELVSLQKQLLGDVFNDKDATVSNTDDGLGKIKDRIGAKTVLLVLDDVNDASQIKELVGNLKWFCSGSRIIITTRDKRVLTLAQVKKNHVYELKGLDDIQSLELFSWHAFGKKEPDAKFADLSNQVASTAAGLPLALTIFGSHFFDLKTVEDWKDMLKKMKKNIDKNIFERLRISFDVLDENEKEVFLDIACFFVGQETKRATLMWEACLFSPKIAISWLIHKSLVSINNEGKFEMHDHVRDMGRKIVQAKAKEAGKYSRLWEVGKTIDVLQNKRGTEVVEAIKLFCGRKDSVHVDAEHLAAMSQLRMLLLRHVTLEGGYEHFPRKLRWLKWSSQALEKFPSSLHLQVFNKLKVLDLSGCVNLSICPDFANMKHLEILSFNDCEKMCELHPSIGLLKCLTHLSLRRCTSLKELPQEVWQLTKLEEFDLFLCSEITTLPSMKQHLPGELKVLKLGYCHNLTTCPDFMGMPHLEILDFEGCKKMSKLHPSIGHLKSLTNLNLTICHSLKELPQEVWQLPSLQEFKLQRCRKITALPSHIWNAEAWKQLLLERLDLSNCSDLVTCPDFTNMPHLQELSFRGCKKITELVPSIWQLRRLMYLDLSYCKSLKELPQEVWQLTSLQELKLSGCNQITALPSQIQNAESLKQPLLERLDLSNCSNLIRCPDFTSMPHLQNLSFSGCEKITELDPSIGQLKRLMELDLFGCKSLKELPQEIGQLTSLKLLTLWGCSSLKEVPQEVWQLTSLQELNLIGCTQITALPSQIWNVESLKPLLLEILDLSDCFDLIRCPDFTSMPHLQELHFRGCKKISKLVPSIGKLKRLMHLNLSDCKSLEDLPQEIGQLASLKQLTLTGCSSLKKVPQEVWKLTSLQELHLSSCTEITALPSQIQNVESLTPLLLERLDLSDCSYLIRCPDFTSMPHLQELHFRGCEKITELDPSIGQLKRLMHLDLEGCKSLKELPQEIGQLTSLKHLRLTDCSSLKEVPREVWQFTSLQELNLSGRAQITALSSQIQNVESLMPPLLVTLVLSNCSNLIRCPDFTSMPRLQKLSFSGCEKITELDPSIGQLKRLRELDLDGCKSLKELPQEIGQLTSLKQLTLRGCSSLKAVHQEVWQLTSLRVLKLSYCTEITALPSHFQNAESLKLPLLEILDLTSCRDLTRCPDFTTMPHLLRLSFCFCERITELDPSIGKLKRLRDFILKDCNSLKELPQEIGQLTSLESLEVSCCSSLKEVLSLPPSLTRLNGSHCHQLEIMADVSNLKELEELSLNGCIRLEDIPGIEQLKCIKRLRLGECGSLVDSLFERVQEAIFQHLEVFSIPGRLINDGSSDPQSIAFILPKQFYYGLLYLYVDQRSLDNICLELEKNNDASTLVDKSIASEDEVTQPVDSQLGRSVVRIDITTDDSQFSFPIFINGWGESRRFPTATFAQSSELMMLAKQGRFKGNEVDDAQGRGMMEMRVSIDGCILLHGDLLTIKWSGIYDDLDVFKVSGNIVQVKFG